MIIKSLISEDALGAQGCQVQLKSSADTSVIVKLSVNVIKMEEMVLKKETNYCWRYKENIIVCVFVCITCVHDICCHLNGIVVLLANHRGQSKQGRCSFLLSAIKWGHGYNGHKEMCVYVFGHMLIYIGKTTLNVKLALPDLEVIQDGWILDKAV